MALPLAAAIGLGAGALKGIGGLFQQGQAKRQLKRLKDPNYNIPDEFSQNVGVAENLSRMGMPTEQYNLASTNIQRGTQAGLRQLGRMGNPFAAIQGLSRGQSDAFASLDASNAATRRQNILQAMGARREMAGQRLAQQQYAQQRFAENVNQANALRGAGLQNMAGGLSDIGRMGLYGAFDGIGKTKKNPLADASGMLKLAGIGKF
jgi:hypothetical protein